MRHGLSTDGLPLPLVSAVRPWIGVVEAASLGMGDEVRAAAGNAGTGLRRRVVVAPALEKALGDAHRASLALADELERRGPIPAAARSADVTALGGLLSALAGAEPNARARELGLGW